VKKIFSLSVLLSTDDLLDALDVVDCDGPHDFVVDNVNDNDCRLEVLGIDVFVDDVFIDDVFIDVDVDNDSGVIFVDEDGVIFVGVAIGDDVIGNVVIDVDFVDIDDFVAVDVINNDDALLLLL